MIVKLLEKNLFDSSYFEELLKQQSIKHNYKIQTSFYKHMNMNVVFIRQKKNNKVYKQRTKNIKKTQNT